MEEIEKLGFSQIVVIGGSAGSLTVLLKLLPDLNHNFKAPLVIVTHRHSAPDNMLEMLLGSRTDLPVKEIEEKEVLKPGTIYLAPADYHVLFEHDRTLSLDYSEKVNFSRPSIDVAFESAAEIYGPLLTAILLSGANSDGTDGIKAVSEHGGTTIVQDPQNAEINYMPTHALAGFSPDYVVSDREIAKLLNDKIS